jgi:hypothetical protein
MVYSFYETLMALLHKDAVIPGIYILIRLCFIKYPEIEISRFNSLDDSTQPYSHQTMTTCQPMAHFTMANPIPAAPSPKVECSRAINTDEELEAEKWITAITEGTSECTVPDDYGLYHIAEHLGTSQTTAVTLYWQGAEKEQTGDISGAMKLYQRAYKTWPALDSIYEAGLPRDVRQEAEAAHFSSCGLLGVVNIVDAQASRVVYAPGLLHASDLRDITAVLQGLTAQGETPLMNNPQNCCHEKKVCTFLNNPETWAMRTHAPHVFRKMIRFARQAWQEAHWSGDADTPGPLFSLSCRSTTSSAGCHNTKNDGMLLPPPLSIRVAEHWEYSIGGGLVDPHHYDVDSVLTIVALLSDESTFEGGTFRTLEADDSQLEHPMAQGDVICFVSHKYHNVVPVTEGKRCSFVMELWQGGLGHIGR